MCGFGPSRPEEYISFQLTLYDVPKEYPQILTKSLWLRPEAGPEPYVLILHILPWKGKQVSAELPSDQGWPV